MRKENRRLEYKEKISPTFLRTVSAFANYDGGRIVFGVADDGTVRGLDDVRSRALDIENAINDAIEPRPEFNLRVNSAAGTITLTVEAGEATPYRCKGRAYRRSDTATVEVDRLELNRLTLRGSSVSFDALPACSRNLTFSLLEARFIERLGIGRLGDDVLRSLGLMRPDAALTRAAELLADQNAYPGIDIVRFGGPDDIRERRTRDGVSLLAQYDAAMDMFSGHYLHELVGSAARAGREDVPAVAFREALANGLVHRTWDTPARMQIALHADRIVLTSPGGLPFGISEEEYLHREISVLRNPLVAEVFFRLGHIERFGTGVTRIIRSYRGTGRTPGFRVSENAVEVTLPVLAAVNDDEQALLAVLDGAGALSRADIVLASGLGRSKVSRLLARLLETGAIRRVGTGRGTKYLAG